MRTITGCWLVLALGAATAAGAAKADPDPKKLLGKWEPTTDVVEGAKVVMTFAKDGKLRIDIQGGGMKDSKTGTYKLAGDKLTVSIGEDKDKTVTVLKLTDDALEFKSESGKTTKFKRVKEECAGALAARWWHV
jgi:uncharacterized protein (TIGR03066 family)